MALSMQEKQHVGKEVALRYLRARKKEKGIMLQEFCATTGYSPPYAAYLLRTYAKRVILGAVTLVPTRPSPWPRERKHVYGPAVVEALVWMYHLAGELCGKRLQAAMPELLRAMARHGTVLPDPLSTALLQMGSATMDRLLREEKARGGNRRHAPRTKPGSLLRLIPIVSSRELSAATPGQVEVDLVSHDGGQEEIIFTPSRSPTAARGGPPSSRSPVVHRSLCLKLSRPSSMTFPSPFLSCTRTTAVNSSTMNSDASVMLMGFALPVPVPGTRMTTATWRARTGPWYGEAWATAGSIRRVSLLTCNSWRPSLLSVPISSNPPWLSSRRSGSGARSRRGTMLL